MYARFGKEVVDCPGFLHHKDIIVTPSFLRRNRIRFFKTDQLEGDIIVTLPSKSAVLFSVMYQSFRLMYRYRWVSRGH